MSQNNGGVGAGTVLFAFLAGATVGGVVAETGGQLSHTAIVAREYALPTVVSVKGATRLIRDGQPVTVDGGTGRVWLRHLDPGEEVR